MKKLLYIIFIGLLFSCNSSETQKKESSKTEHVNKPVIDSIKTEQTAKEEEVNESLKNALRGVWASNEYKKALFRSNSVTKAEKAVTFYTDIVFDGKEILHCNKPSFMEEHYLYLKSDSTVTNYNGEPVFAIMGIKNETMQVKNTNNVIYTYTRVIQNADLGSVYMEVTKGTTSIEKQWIAGKYDIKLDNLDFKAELKENGEVESNLHVKWILPFSYLDKDIIEFRFENDSILLYTIKNYSDTIISLEGIENITEMDAPIIPNNKVGYMRKI